MFWGVYFTWNPYQHVYIHVQIYMNTGVLQMRPGPEMGEILEAEAIRLSMEAAPEVLWQGWWEDGKMGTDVFLQASLMGFIALPVWLMMLGFAVDLLSFDTFHYLSLCGGLFLSPLAAHKSLQWISDAFWGLETCPVEVGFWLDLKVLVIVLVPNNMCMQFTFHVSVALH